MITLKDAKKIIEAAELKAAEIGQPMNIAVADAGGNLVSHVRMDGAWIGSIDIYQESLYLTRLRYCDERPGDSFTIGWPVLRHPCFERWKDHDFCRWHTAST